MLAAVSARAAAHCETAERQRVQLDWQRVGKVREGGVTQFDGVLASEQPELWAWRTATQRNLRKICLQITDSGDGTRAYLKHEELAGSAA